MMPTASRTNGMAIAAFVLGLLWICGVGSVLGIVLGIVALSQIKRTRERGQGFAIAGIALGSLAIVGMGVALVAGAFAANEVDDAIEAENIRESRDVDIGTCTTDALGQLSATVIVTNNSSKASNYIIEVTFESGNGSTQLDTSVVLVNELEPGQRTEQEAISFDSAPSDFTCRVSDVERFAAE
jgi:hypothetical protein